jgi:threonine synthase
MDAATLATWRGASYDELAARVMRPFVGGAIAPAALRDICRAAYRDFGHRAIAPLRQIGPDDWLLELFHGPTLAFKDYALQLVGRMFEHALARDRRRLTIVGATSGDTGSAAIEACRDREGLAIVILHPRGRVSEVQRRQMTTVASPNVHNLAIDGTFDDCQDLVKAMFNDQAFRDAHNLTAVNSINWARIAAQAVYYVAAALALGAPRRPVEFVVPTGNFGNVFSGYVAARMGVPIKRLIIASNRNDILTRLFETGTMDLRPVEPSLSPSMDIQVSSNFERMLFELADRDGAAVARMVDGLRRGGRLALSASRMARLRRLFAAARADDAATIETIARARRETGMLVDPHTAVGLRAGEGVARLPGVARVYLATAHPAKFPDAVERATGQRPALPASLADLHQRRENMTILPNDLAAVRRAIARRAA